jgi:hypothetical protein
MLLTPEEIVVAATYNAKEYAAGRLTDEHIAIAMAFFQEASELTLDGKAGPKTRAALEAANEVEDADPVLPGLPEGKGMFIRALSHTGEPADLVKQMGDAGLTWVCAQAIWQYKDKESSVWVRGRMAEYSEAVQAAGFGFWVWGYPVPGKEEEFTEVMFEALDKAQGQGIIIDPEKPYYGTTGYGTVLMQALMPGCITRGVLLGFTSYGAPWFHQKFPWAEFATAHFAVPQTYDAENNLGADYPAKSQEAYREYGFKVIIPGSGAWGKTEEQMTTLLANTPTPQGSIIWWDWYNADQDDLWGPIIEFVPGCCREVPPA